MFDSSVPVWMCIFPLHHYSVFWAEKSLFTYLFLCFEKLHSANHLCHLISSFSLCIIYFLNWSNWYCSQNSRYGHMHSLSLLLSHCFIRFLTFTSISWSVSCFQNISHNEWENTFLRGKHKSYPMPAVFLPKVYMNSGVALLGYKKVK